MLPTITTKQMVEVDRIMMEDLAIPVELMMEHAGLNFAKLAASTGMKKFLVVAGSGNNGAGGMVAGRKLAAWGFDVDVYLPKGENALRKVARDQFGRALRAGCGKIGAMEDSRSEILMDAYIGYGFRGSVDEHAKNVIQSFNNFRVLSLDSPSGIDTTTGSWEVDFEVEATATIAYPKSGHLGLDIGRTFLIDIGVPKGVIKSVVGDYSEIDTLYDLFKTTSMVNIAIGDTGWSINE